MGYERYCYICNGPLNNTGIFTVKNINTFLKILNLLKNPKHKQLVLYTSNECDVIPELLRLLIKENKSKKKLEKILNYIKTLPKDYITISLKKSPKYKWLNKLILLHKNGNNIKIIKSDSWEGEFYDKDNNEYFIGNNKPNKEDDFVIIHQDCYNLMNKNKNFNYNSLKTIKNKPNKYNTQDIYWLRYFINKDEYLLKSPLK